MPKGLEEIRSTLAKISQGDDLLTMLCEFERTMDTLGMFAYQNWLDGELVVGPEISKYWFKTVWMFHKDKMPDPRAALRLKKIGCKVWFEEDILNQPRRILEPSDWDDRNTKKAKIDEVPIWLVHVIMPMKYITDGHDEIHRLQYEQLDTSADVSSVFEPDDDDMSPDNKEEF